mmetsp:Transcript_17816/g.24447  ORF Transcript_17816/g.24447 Transcript_17816/m.24447 type:complete len:321 (+) Transcript_17816:153-1115(+)
MVNGGGNTNDDVSQNHIKISGLPEVIDLFKKSCIKTIVELPVTIPQSSIEQSNAAIILNRGAGPRLSSVVDGLQPLKAGWLLKKRDILTGWRCRYFVVYKGKVEYYVDPHDLQPRQSLLLAGADIQPYKRVSVNGVGEYWGLVIETKQKEKMFRLASELTGMEGKVEASSWETVFREASKSDGAELSLSVSNDLNPLRLSNRIERRSLNLDTSSSQNHRQSEIEGDFPLKSNISLVEESRNKNHGSKRRLMTSILCMTFVITFCFSFLYFAYHLVIQKEFTMMNMIILGTLLMGTVGSAYITDTLDAWIFFRLGRKFKIY